MTPTAMHSQMTANVPRNAAATDAVSSAGPSGMIPATAGTANVRNTTAAQADDTPALLRGMALSHSFSTYPTHI